MHGVREQYRENLVHISERLRLTENVQRDFRHSAADDVSCLTGYSVLMIVAGNLGNVQIAACLSSNRVSIPQPPKTHNHKLT